MNVKRRRRTGCMQNARGLTRKTFFLLHHFGSKILNICENMIDARQARKRFNWMSEQDNSWNQIRSFQRYRGKNSSHD